MDQQLILVFRTQIEFQCAAVLSPNEAIKLGVARLNANEIEGIFCAIQSLLTAAANISKACWGVEGGTFSAQRVPLRAAIGIADDSPLRKVGMRNNFDHFDERLDEWWLRSPFHAFADLNIGVGPPPAVDDPRDLFRWFNPTTTEVRFWGDTFNLREIVDEVHRILPSLTK